MSTSKPSHPPTLAEELRGLKAASLSARECRIVERAAAALEAQQESALNVATRLARQVFKKRGDHSEIHVNEEMLAAMLVLAIERSALGQEGEVPRG